MLNPSKLRAYEQPLAKLTAQHAHATDRCAHEIIGILTPVQALAAADAQSVGPPPSMRIANLRLALLYARPVAAFYRSRGAGCYGLFTCVFRFSAQLRVPFGRQV